jgi:plasmid stability protein
MRTTIRLEDDLLRRAKARAAASGRSLNDFISDAVRAALVPPRGSSAAVALPTFPGGVLRPGVDLDDSGALLDLMDETVDYAADPVAQRNVAESAARGRSRTGGRRP